MQELRGLGAVHTELAGRGGRLLVVSVDKPADSRVVVEKMKLPYALLSDPDRATIKAYHLLHEKGAPDGSDIAIPAHFLLDREGVIQWRFVADSVTNRPEPRQIIDEIRKIQ